MILVMGALVLGLGAASAWVLMHGEAPTLQPTADERALRQVREQRGASFDVRYAEPGRGRAVCGYAGPRNGVSAVAFVSRPNRILFSDDPLPVEFREVQQRFCPGFLATPNRVSPQP